MVEISPWSQRSCEAKIWRCTAGLLVADSQMVEIPPWLQGPSKHRCGSVTVGLLAADSRMVEIPPWLQGPFEAQIWKYHCGTAGGGKSDD